MSDRLPMFQLLGVRPIVVEELGRDALLLPEHGLIFIDADADVAEVADWALSYGVLSLSQPPGGP